MPATSYLNRQFAAEPIREQPLRAVFERPVAVLPSVLRERTIWLVVYDKLPNFKRAWDLLQGLCELSPASIQSPL